MSVNAAQLFVRARDSDAVTAFVAEYLKAFLSQHGKAGLPDGRLMDKDGRRAVLILPAIRGWVTILELDHRNSDLNLGAALSQHFQCRTVGLEVQGCVFNYRFARIENGEPREMENLLTDDEEASEVLPEFRDAEALAWEKAIQIGVPPETLFLRFKDVAAADEGTTLNAAVFEMVPEGEGVRLGGRKLAVRVPLQPTQPRAYFDMVLAPKENNPAAGAPQFAIETHILWGRPEPAAVDRLAHHLRRMQRRYSRASGLPLESIRYLVMAGEPGKPERVSLPDDLAGPDVSKSSGKPKPAPGKDPFAF